MDILLLLMMTTYKDECQTPKRWQLSQQLATHTAHDHNSQLKMEHLANTNDSSNLSETFARYGRKSSLNISRTCRDSKEQYEPIVWLADEQPTLRKHPLNRGWAGTNSKNSLEQVSKGQKFHLVTNVCKLCVTVKWYRINGVYVVNENFL